MAAPITLSGARVLLYINGKTLPLVSDVTITTNQTHIEIREVDSPVAAEIAPNTYSVSVDLTAFRVPTESPTQIGLVPAVNQLLKTPYIGLELKDRLTDSTLFFSPNMRVDTSTLTVSARNLASNRISLKGIYGWDESGPNGEESTGLLNQLLGF